MTTPIPRRTFLQGLGASLALPYLGNASAQDLLPMARITIGFAAGGMTDTMARRLADKLTGTYAKTVLVDNRAGAGGQIAASVVKPAPKDGSVLLITPGAVLTIFPHVYKKLPYNALTDFEAVSLTTVVDSGWAVGPAVPDNVTNVAQYLEWCRSHPLGGSFATPGAGSTSHFCGELLGRANHVDLRHTPYRGAQPAIQDMLGGQVPAVCTAVGDFLPYLGSGKCRVLATSGPTRTKFTPQVPTFAEQGFKDATVVEWFGAFAPAGTPPEVIARANKALVAALAAPDYVEAMGKVGQPVVSSSAADLNKRMHEDNAFWGKVVRDTNFSIE
ncbi:twin-arginine translocation pathway signal protein [Ramlibacter sp. G-1-2-2]|uniref:Twin-arginine translocation pathway signal protein n=1 Tax=Ramlibacter agri TaxID=2728837 RepID=A0A848HCY3_9BURK|nr:Bug family tripartite tricarboxylate transporter substrate binding protein [Ramlibacter agri]NML46403.1 twin-arginine translocation pathway signal protein [Ramlibacter agri]